MVRGIEKFREFFTGHEQDYVIIGGAACDLLFSDAGLEFRATKDIDMVLCVEAVDAAFGHAFKRFIDAGGYQARERGDGGKKEFYRFHKPTDASFPFMIELFARRPGALNLPAEAELTRIPVDEEVVSLSAILLDDVYYEALKAGKREMAGVTIIDHTLLIPLKAHAFLNYKARAAAGEQVDSKHIKKHRADVLRLTQLLAPEDLIHVPEPIREDLRRFVADIQADTLLDVTSLKLALSKDEAIALLRSVYELGGD